MLHSTTAQEALVAELLGDMRQLIERAEAFEATLDKAREAMTRAAWSLDSRVEPFRQGLAAEIEKTKDIAVQAFIGQTNRIAELEARKQIAAMAEGARTVVADEVVLPLRQFSGVLQRLVKENSRPWRIWAIHAATAITSASISGSLVFYFFGR